MNRSTNRGARAAVSVSRSVLGLAALALPLTFTACAPADETEDVGGAETDTLATGELAALSSEEQAMLVDPEYVQVPGYRMHRSCVHQVPDDASIGEEPDGSVVIKRDGRVLAKHPKCSRGALDMRRVSRSLTGAGPAGLPTIRGWVENSTVFNAPWNNGRNWFARITGVWTVPANPTQNGGLVYFFNDLVTGSTLPNEILQPVLQWGVGPFFGGNRWTIASWWVSSNGSSAVSTPFTVSPGDRIEGHVARAGNTCSVAGVCDWNVWTNAPTHVPSLSTKLTFTTTTQAFRRADQGVLEAYNVTSCNQLPNSPSITFSNGLLYQPAATGDHNPIVEMYANVAWSQSVTSGLSPACGYSVTNNSSTRGTTLRF
jgi:hypothetical protein